MVRCQHDSISIAHSAKFIDQTRDASRSCRVVHDDPVRDRPDFIARPNHILTRGPGDDLFGHGLTAQSIAPPGSQFRNRGSSR